MEIIVDAQALHKALTQSVSTKGTLPITEYVLLVANADESLTIVSTDLAVQVTLTLPAQVVHNGTVCAKLDLLKTALQKASGDARLVMESATVLRVLYQRRRYTIPVFPAGDFPLDEHFERKQVGIDGNELRLAISKIQHAAGTNDVRYFLNTVRIEPKHFVATDGHCLSVYKTQYDDDGVNVPIGTVKVLACHINDETCFFIGYNGADACRFIAQNETSELIIRLTEGKYPDIVNVIPRKRNAWTITFDADELAETVQRVSAFTIDIGATNIGKAVDLDVTEDQLRVSAVIGDTQTADAGCENVSCKVKGAPEVVRVSSMYLLQALKVLSGETVQWTSCSPTQVQKLTAAKRKDVHYIMPMRR